MSALFVVSRVFVLGRCATWGWVEIGAAQLVAEKWEPDRQSAHYWL